MSSSLRRTFAFLLVAFAVAAMVSAPALATRRAARSRTVVPAAIGAPTMMACTNTKGTITPCTTGQSVSPYATGVTQSFTLKNTGASYVEGNVTCGYTEVVQGIETAG